MHKRTLRLLGGLAASALLITACGNGLEGDDDGDAAGEVVDAGAASLEGATITVGSKDFDEQLVLGNISVALLEDAGVEVVNEVNLGGTDAARAALVNGDIDHYWEYTGTAWISFFGETEPIADRVEQYEAVRVRDAEERGLYWLEPTPFNNTYGLALSQEADAELGVDSISELGALLETDPDAVTLCVESEFNVRDDGLPGMEAHYGFEIPSDNVTVLDTGVIYGATADRDPCNLGEVFITDGRIAALDLKVLEDDEAFFPLYNVSPVFVEDIYAEYGQALRDLYAPVAAALDNDTMAALNARVSADGERPSDVAVDWLTENGFIG
ncbi:MAG: glycine betaine ABC transporter substrate-binding protein [Nitriliruptoraceae bacterium]